MLFDLPLDKITESHLEALVGAQERESKTLEYKAQLPGGSDADRKEFLFDVSSFANSSGGDIFYGIEAENGLPRSIPGIPKQSVDAEILRLESIIQSGIAPRIPGLRMRAIDLKTQNCVLAVRIPKTWAGPHMVALNKSNKFYARNSAGKYLLDVEELRAAFSMGEELGTKILAFRLERVNTILNRQLSIPVPDAPKNVLHILPLASFRPGFQVDLQTAKTSGANELVPMTANGWDRHFNYDGLLTYRKLGDQVDTYLQLFRNGCVEAVESEASPVPKSKVLNSFVVKDEMIACGRRMLVLLPKLGVEPPYVLALSLLGIRGYAVWANSGAPLRNAHPIERDNLFLDDFVLENVNEDFAEFVNRWFDRIWNACGYANAPTR